MTLNIEDMARLHARCFTNLRPWSAPEIARILANPHSFALMHPHGFLLAQAVAGEAEILTLAVDPNLRRQGIGRTLVTEFCEQARQKAAQTAFLEVASNNTAAIALYRAIGFSQSGLRRAYYRGLDGSLLDGVVLSCLL